MMRAALLSAITAAAFGCSAPGTTPPSPVLEPHPSGATVYVVQAYEDWLDDGPDLTSSYNDGSPVLWMGEQALGIVLHALAKGKSAVLLHSEHTDLRAGESMRCRISISDPTQFPAPAEDGRDKLWKGVQPGTLNILVTPTILGKENLLVLTYALERVYEARPETKGAAAVALPTERASGKRELPLGATLLIPFSPRQGQVLIVLIHLASVQ